VTTTPTIWKTQHQGNPTDAGNQLDLALVDIGLGRYVAVWTELNGGPIGATAGHDIVGQVYDAEGNPIGSEFQVNVDWTDDNETKPALAARPDGGFVMVYEDTDASGTSIVVQVYDVDGNVVPLTPISITLDAGADILANPSVAVRDDGSFLVVYQRGDGAGDTDIVGKIVSPAGVVGAEFDIVNQTDDTEDPEVAVLSNGNYVVVAQDEDAGDGSNRDVEIRIVSSAGAILNGEVIDDAEGDDQTDVQVAALAGGGFVVVWTEENGDGSGEGIRAAIYDSDGNLEGSVFTANTPAAGNQNAADIVALGDGGFVVVWDDNAAGVTRGQRFNASGAKVGDEFVAGDDGAEMEPVVALLGDGRFIAGFDQVGGAETDAHLTIFDPRENVIAGTGENDVITARLEGATINGLDGDDTLLGQGGNDILDGGAGEDVMSGRGGNDTYHVDSIGDDVNEIAGGGTDTVSAVIDYALSANVENLILVGAAVQGVGNGLSNVIAGNALNNTLIGLAGNDILDGGAGADIMQGGGDNDVYIVDDTGDVVSEEGGAGVDLVQTGLSYILGANVENLLLTGAAANGTGNELANLVTGNGTANTLLGLDGNDTLGGRGGDDLLDGGTGADMMLGGSGDDVYIVDDAGDEAIENVGEGVDLVSSTVDFVLAADVENLELTGTAASGTGNGLANIITGNASANILSGLGGNDSLLGHLGNDRLDGGTGADRMEGGLGDDIYAVDDLGDVVIENLGEGIDRIESGISYTLGATVENLVLTGTAVLGRGNVLGNTITGNDAANRLKGLGGPDTLLGEGGNDKLIGGKGKDKLVGGLGKDKLVGNGGKDAFVFDTTLGGGNVDKIRGFKSGKDKIWLDKDIFSAIGGKLGKHEFEVGRKADDGNDYLIFNRKSHTLSYDANGDDPGGKVALAKFGNDVNLGRKDFAMFEDFAV
jgi:Ca2+-binding RTX toxin-like protein